MQTARRRPTALDYRSPRHRPGSGTRLADSHGVAEVVESTYSSPDVGLGAAPLVVNVFSSDCNGLATLFDSGTSERTHDLLQGFVPFDDGLAAGVLASGKPGYWSTLAERDRDRCPSQCASSSSPTS